jgi:molybdate transport system substrate-binding protein
MRASALGAAVLLLAGIAGCTGSSGPASPAASAPATASAPAALVVVFAASSLTEVVAEAAEPFTRATGREARFQLGASSTLARQIREGAPADVFVSADPAWLDAVSPTARYDWLGNRLALCVPAGRAGDVKLAEVASLALAGPEVPAGKYARAALASLGVPLPARVVEGSSVRDVLSKVAEGAADAGIVYATDVAVEPRVRLASLLPGSSHPPIRYAVGLLREAGRGLFDALRAPEALEAARKRGFSVPER